MSAPRVAIVHDYLNQRGGAERVVAAIHRLFPHAPIFTSIVNDDRLWPEMVDARIVPSWMQRLPGVQRRFKAFLPLYPLVFDRLDLKGFDLILSSSSSFAKGVRAPQGAAHICYCHGPTRFLWDPVRYLEGERIPRPLRWALEPVLRGLRRWDLAAARRPGTMIANSHYSASRLARIYGRSCVVVYPPVETGRFRCVEAEADRYLVLARLAGYKRVDLAVRACTKLGRRLLVAGAGPARAALEAVAGSCVEFIDPPREEALPPLFARARALLVGAEEDFGMTMVEAMAAGRPVVAFGRGGACEIVEDGVTGVTFAEQTVEAMEAAILESERLTWDRDRIRARADRFSAEVFDREYLNVVDRALGRCA